MPYGLINKIHSLSLVSVPRYPLEYQSLGKTKTHLKCQQKLHKPSAMKVVGRSSIVGKPKRLKHTEYDDKQVFSINH